MASGIVDENNARRSVLEYFKNLPILDFSRQVGSIDFVYPQITPRRVTNPQQSTGALGPFMEAASRRFVYSDFFDQRVYEQLCWAGETLRSDHDYYDVQYKKPARLKIINENRDTASKWFRQEVVDRIKPLGERQKFCQFLVGEPGAGKSTFIKYLVNKERDYCRSHSVVFSRLEASKFFRYVEDRVLRSSKRFVKEEDYLDFQSLCLRDYYKIICLRDIFFNFCLRVESDGRLIEQSQPFGGRSGLRNFFDRALPKTYSDIQVQDIFEAVTNQIEDGKFRFDVFFRLKPVEVEALLSEAIRTVERHIKSKIQICIVFDGFDLLGPEDYNLDGRRFFALLDIINIFGLLNRQNFVNKARPRKGVIHLPIGGIDTAFPLHALVMLRQNTYDLLVAEIDGGTLKKVTYMEVIGRLSIDVVLLKAIKGALRETIKPACSEDDIEKKATYIFNFLEQLMHRLSAVTVKGEEHERTLKLQILSIFGSNIRDCIEFTQRMITLLREEGEEVGKIDASSTIEDLANFSMTADSVAIARKRSYRSIEVLLFFKRTFFCNAACYRRPSSPGKMRLEHDLEKNDLHTGLIDNVFNYHSFVSSGNTGHFLLSKIRILQFLGNGDIRDYDKIREHLKSLGYNVFTPGFFDEALDILRHTGAISVDHFHAEMFMLTPRGRALIEKFVFEPDYLEHVFHSTLFPAVLVGDISDRTRGEGHHNWALSSIRNYFILLTYIRFIEDVDVLLGVARVPESYKLLERMRVKIVDAVERIFRASSLSDGLGVSVLKELDATIAFWRSGNVLASTADPMP